MGSSPGQDLRGEEERARPLFLFVSSVTDLNCIHWSSISTPSAMNSSPSTGGSFGARRVADDLRRQIGR
jgi:hypothetical protein